MTRASAGGACEFLRGVLHCRVPTRGQYLRLARSHPVLLEGRTPRYGRYREGTARRLKGRGLETDHEPAARGLDTRDRMFVETERVDLAVPIEPERVGLVLALASMKAVGERGVHRVAPFESDSDAFRPWVARQNERGSDDPYRFFQLRWMASAKRPDRLFKHRNAGGRQSFGLAAPNLRKKARVS